MHFPPLIGWHNDCHPVPKIAAHPVPDDGCTGGFWMHHASHRQIHAVGAAIVDRVCDAMRMESASARGPTSFLSSSGGSTTGNGLGMASLEDADSVSPE